MKKFRGIIIAFFAVMAFGLIVMSCGDSSSSSSDTPAATETAAVATGTAAVATGTAAVATETAAVATETAAVATGTAAVATATATTAPTAPASISWTTLDGSVIPSSATPVWTYAGTNSDPTATWTSASGILTLANTTTAADTSVWKLAQTAFASAGKITTIFRVQNTATANKGIDIMFNLGGSASGITVKFIVSTGATGFQLEKPDGTTSISDKTNVTVTNYNIYQATIDYTATSATVNVYLNGSDTPLSTFTNITVSRAATSNYATLLIGDNGSNAYNSNIDYLIFTTDGCYIPSQVKALLPSSIGDTTGY